MSDLVVGAKVPPLLEVPDYLLGDVKKDLNNQRADLEKRIASLRGWADRFNAKCGDRQLSEDDPLAKDCLAEKAKMNQAGQDYSRDALAFDDEVLKATAIGRVALARDAIIITPDGRTLSADDIGKTGVNLGSHILTGPNGRVQVLLNDETVFTLGPNSDMTLDEFVYDPKTSAGKVTANIAKGLFRFVTGKVARQTPDNLKVKVSVGTIGVRGTDFEVSAEPGGDGYVELFSGKLEVTETKSGDKLNLDGGQMVKFHADGTWEPITSLDAVKPSI